MATFTFAIVKICHILSYFISSSLLLSFYYFMKSASYLTEYFEMSDEIFWHP